MKCMTFLFLTALAVILVSGQNVSSDPPPDPEAPKFDEEIQAPTASASPQGTSSTSTAPKTSAAANPATAINLEIADVIEKGKQRLRENFEDARQLAKDGAEFLLKLKNLASARSLGVLGRGRCQ